MTKLWTIEAEARRMLGRMPEARWQALRASLVGLCEAHWPEMRGPEPATGLAKALWAVPPHLADLFVHLFGIGDPRLADILDRLKPQQALAVLVLAEIERGDAEGARAAYEALRLFESPATQAIEVRAILSPPPGHEPEARLRHAHRPALWRAVVGFAVRTGRRDPRAVRAGLGFVAQVQAGGTEAAEEPALQSILGMLQDLGIVILEVGEDRLRFALRGKEQPPVPFRRLAEILAEGRAEEGR